MPFETFVHYVHSLPPTKKIDLDSLSISKKISNTVSSWQIIQISKTFGVGMGGGGRGVCGLGEWG